MVVENQASTFWAFGAERHEIFIRRHVLKRRPPWTTDHILANGFFTNVYRDLDRVTRWLMVHVVDNNPLAATDLAFSILVYRRFCAPDTFVAIGGARPRTSYDWRAAEQILAERQQSGLPIFTGAFIISADRSGRAKHVQVAADLALTSGEWPAVWARVQAAPSLERAHAALQVLPSLGPFMAYELLIDLCNSGLLPHSLDSWVFVGPGAIRGVAALIGRTPSETEAERIVHTLRDRQDEQMAAAGVRLRGPRLTLENVEQALCEYQKYVALRQAGRVKRFYREIRSDEGLWDNLPSRFHAMVAQVRAEGDVVSPVRRPATPAPSRLRRGLKASPELVEWESRVAREKPELLEPRTRVPVSVAPEPTLFKLPASASRKKLRAQRVDEERARLERRRP